VTFVLKGGYDRAKRFLDALKMLCITSNLGDSRSIATHPASTTHSKLTEAERLQLGIQPGSMRISVGLEDVADIIGDLEQALTQSKL